MWKAFTRSLAFLIREDNAEFSLRHTQHHPFGKASVAPALVSAASLVRPASFLPLLPLGMASDLAGHPPAPGPHMPRSLSLFVLWQDELGAVLGLHSSFPSPSKLRESLGEGRLHGVRSQARVLT